MTNKQKNLLFLIPSVLCIIGITVLTYFCSSNRLNSDMSAELILARELASKNKLISTSWFYSTELRILNTQLIAVPLFKIFRSWRVIRTIQCFILNGILLYSYCYCMKKVNLKDTYKYLSSVLLFIPFSITYMDIVQIGNFYIPHYIISFFMFGFTVALFQKVTVMKTIIYLLFSFVCGISSVRYLLVIQLPLVAASIVAFYHECIMRKESILEWKNVTHPRCVIPIVGLVLSGIGYIINEKVLHQIFSFRSNDNMTFLNMGKSNLLSRIGDKLADLFRLFGYYDGHKVMSPSGICSLLAIFIVIIIIYIVCTMIKHRNDLTVDEYFIVLLFVMSFLINTFVYIFSEGAYQARYYIVTLVLLVPTVGIFISKQSFIGKDSNLLAVIILGIALSVNGLGTSYWTVKYNNNRNIQAVCTYLKNQKIDFGYASFWNAGILTELSDGEINVVNIKDFSTMSSDNWLMPKRYLSKDILSDVANDNVFILLTSEEYLEYKDSYIIQEGKCVYNEKNYMIFLYDKASYWDKAFTR